MADGGYGSWTALAQAIKAAATRARADGTTNQDVAAQIVQARQDRHKRRQTTLDRIETFTVPDGWERQYRTLAGATPSAGEITDVHDAEQFVRSLVDPALVGGREQTWWAGHGWSTDDAPPPTDADAARS